VKLCLPSTCLLVQAGFLCALRDPDLFHRAQTGVGCKSAEEGFAGLKPGAYISPI